MGRKGHKQLDLIGVLGRPAVKPLKISPQPRIMVLERVAPARGRRATGTLDKSIPKAPNSRTPGWD